MEIQHYADYRFYLKFFLMQEARILIFNVRRKIIKRFIKDR